MSRAQAAFAFLIAPSMLMAHPVSKVMFLEPPDYLLPVARHSPYRGTEHDYDDSHQNRQH
jgi:hypothetical protein